MESVAPGVEVRPVGTRPGGRRPVTLPGEPTLGEPPRSYVVTFDRVGRDHDVLPLRVSGDADSLAEAIHAYVRPKLASREVRVYVDLGQMRGFIGVGVAHVGGEFTLAVAE